MSVSGISSKLYSFQENQSNSLTRIRNDFDRLGSALQSGDLSDAKQALAQLQQDISCQGVAGSNPLSSDLESLGTALDSGDIEAAQKTYESIKAKLTQGPEEQAAGGTSASGREDTVTLSGDAATSQSGSTVFDARDTNQDGFVSFQEEIEYSLKHPGETDMTQQSSESSGGGIGSFLNIKA
jgi:hypothetical protein